MIHILPTCFHIKIKNDITMVVLTTSRNIKEYQLSNSDLLDWKTSIRLNKRYLFIPHRVMSIRKLTIKCQNLF